MNDIQEKSMTARRVGELDSYIGGCIRACRVERNVSQARLAELLGISFQQVQKYERGTNRISAARLFELARAFEVSIKEFYPTEGDGVPARSGIRTKLKAERSRI